MKPPDPHTYEFDEFRVDAVRRVLLRNDETVPLTPKVFDTLLYLVGNGGRVLGKDELMKALWPDAFVEENNLTQSISSLRRALGEAKGENRYIVTVPGHGYRFAAEVKQVAQDLVEDPRKSSTTELRRRSAVRPLIIGLCIFAVLGLAGLYLWRRAQPSLPRVTKVRSIAVLPFKPLVTEGRDEALELGMADTLVTRLSSVRQVVVSPISAVRKYSGLDQNPLAAGRELGVDTVLDGTIQRWGERIRVAARLTSVSDGTTLWAGQFDERFADIFQVQDSISERVADQLVPRLTGEEREQLAKRYTENTEAYELYLKGRFFWGRRTREGDEQALQFFRQALDRDSNYALAHAGLAEYYRSLPISRDVRASEAMPRAKEEVEKALQLDDRLAEAHTAWGWIKFFYDWDWAGSEREHRRALEINPNLSAAHVGYGTLLSCLGRHDEALAEMDRAHRLDPLSPLGVALHGQSLYFARRYPEAVEYLRRGLEVTPDFWIALIQLGKSYERLGRYDEALAAFKKANETGGATEALSLSGFTYAIAGRKAEAERALSELTSIGERSYVPPYNVALIYHGLGDTDNALKWLERALEERDAHLVQIAVEPRWDSLRANSRFQELVKRLGLPQ
jgi:DNA-binding winged helix-turn-helix (wHTH) protein/TolB-like protein/Tfp pilus assembly protein PilF